MSDETVTGSQPPGLTAHDRLGYRRTDEAWLDAAWHDPRTRILPVSGGTVLARDGSPAWLPAGELATALPGVEPDAGVRILLGAQEADGTQHFAWYVPEQEGPEQEGDAWVGVRMLARHLFAGGWDLPLVFHAIGMSEWLDRTRFCPRCGGALAARHAGHVLACADCGREHFPRIEPAVIMLITDGEPGSPDERCLLGSGLQWGAHRFSTLAGFAEPGEALEDAVRREVFEEAGVRVGEVTWFASQPWPFPSSLMLGFTGRAVSTEITVDPVELADARWFTRAELEAQAESGDIALPGRGISISRTLIEDWYGGELPGSW